MTRNARVVRETVRETRYYVKVLYSFRRSFIADIGVGNAALIFLFFIYVYIYVYIYIHTCTDAYVYIYIISYVRTYVCIYTYIYTLISDPNYRVNYRLILKNTHVYVHVQLQHTPGRQESWSSEILMMILKRRLNVQYTHLHLSFQQQQFYCT